MVIYTKTGDKGTTALFGGKRISKADLQIETYGTIDELSSFIGLVNSQNSLTRNSKLTLIDIQKDLYKIMAFLSGADEELKFLENRIEDFEREIDGLDKKLPKLTKFILPGGTELSSWFHILRTVCRRAERNVVHFFSYNRSIQQESNILIMKYLNRLSDLFFTFARYFNNGKDQLV